MIPDEGEEVEDGEEDDGVEGDLAPEAGGALVQPSGAVVEAFDGLLDQVNPRGEVGGDRDAEQHAKAPDDEAVFEILTI